IAMSLRGQVVSWISQFRNELRVMLSRAVFPSFEEGSLRPTNKCHATLNRAQRGRSEPSCDSGLTSPAAPNLRERDISLIGAATPPGRGGNRSFQHSSYSFTPYFSHPPTFYSPGPILDPAGGQCIRPAAG